MKYSAHLSIAEIVNIQVAMRAAVAHERRLKALGIDVGADRAIETCQRVIEALDKARPVEVNND